MAPSQRANRQINRPATSRIVVASSVESSTRARAAEDFTRRNQTVEPFNEWFKSLFELEDRVWHRGLENNQTQLLAAIFVYQLLVRYNHRKGYKNAQSRWIIDSLRIPGHPRLSEKDRTILESRYSANMTVTEIADAFERSPGAVYHALARIRSALHRCIMVAMTPSEDHQEQQLTQLKQPAPARSHWFAIAIAVSVLIATFFVANNWLSDRISQQAVGATRPAVITAVRDNVRQEDVFNYYEIVHGGMAEEASAFVDRNAHEYDGMTADGMPEYLVGGDFIKTFNNDKANRKINIDITDSCPTKLDLIVDNRSSIPKWLVEDFRDTEDDLGYDERPLYMKGKLVNKCTNSVGQVRASITQLLFGSEKFTSQEQSC